MITKTVTKVYSMYENRFNSEAVLCLSGIGIFLTGFCGLVSLCMFLASFCKDYVSDYSTLLIQQIFAVSFLIGIMLLAGADLINWINKVVFLK